MLQPTGLIFIFGSFSTQCTQEEVSSEDEDEEMPEVGLLLKTALAGSVCRQHGSFDPNSSSFKWERNSNRIKTDWPMCTCIL